MTEFSRENPSPRYVELLNYYAEMHVHGAVEQNHTAAETFDGRSLGPHVDAVERIARVLGSETILDYGSGKGTLYKASRVDLPDGRSFAGIADYWGVQSITCYDPGHQPFSQLPLTIFDGVVCTDVMEHCPKEDVPWILGEIFGFAREFVYINIACYPAAKTLPNGENAHCTIETPDWWLTLLNAEVGRKPGLRYFTTFDVLQNGPGDTQTIQKIVHQAKNTASLSNAVAPD